MNRYFILAWALAAAVACGAPRLQVQPATAEVTQEASVDSLGEGLYFSPMVLSLNRAGDDVVMLDRSRQQAVRLDAEMRLRNFIGRSGRGPQELTERYDCRQGAVFDECWRSYGEQAARMPAGAVMVAVNDACADGDRICLLMNDTRGRKYGGVSNLVFTFRYRRGGLSPEAVMTLPGNSGSLCADGDSFYAFDMFDAVLRRVSWQRAE